MKVKQNKFSRILIFPISEGFVTTKNDSRSFKNLMVLTGNEFFSIVNVAAITATQMTCLSFLAIRI